MIDEIEIIKAYKIGEMISLNLSHATSVLVQERLKELCSDRSLTDVIIELSSNAEFKEAFDKCFWLGDIKYIGRTEVRY